MFQTDNAKGLLNAAEATKSLLLGNTWSQILISVVLGGSFSFMVSLID